MRHVNVGDGRAVDARQRVLAARWHIILRQAQKVVRVLMKLTSNYVNTEFPV